MEGKLMLEWIAAGGLLLLIVIAWGVWDNVLVSRNLSIQIAALARMIHEGQQGGAGPEAYAKAVWEELERVQDRNRATPWDGR